MGLTARERMSIAISRDLKDGEVVLTGAASAVPLAACLLAQARHAPGLTILGAGVYINPRRLVPEFTAGWDCAPVAIADMSDVFAVTELGIDVMFYGGMQIDQYGSVNLHYVPTASGVLRGPGLANCALGHTAARTILYTERHDRRTLVEAVDYASERFPGTFAFLDSVLVLSFNERYTADHATFVADGLCSAVQAARKNEVAA